MDTQVLSGDAIYSPSGDEKLGGSGYSASWWTGRSLAELELKRDYYMRILYFWEEFFYFYIICAFCIFGRSFFIFIF